MKKQQVDHVVRAAGRITGEKQFVIIGSQSLHGKYPDMADEIVMSAEVDLVAAKSPQVTELLNEIGVDSLFHQSHGYYADPVDATTAILPRGWKGRLVNLPQGDTAGVKGLCLDPHDLAIAKYVARRDKDIVFTRELARRGLDRTPVATDVRERMRADIASGFGSAAKRGRREKRRDDQGLS